MRSPRLFLSLALLAISFSPFPASADDAVNCDNAKNTHEMNTCARKEFEAADAELNKAYKRALALIPEYASDDPDFSAEKWEKVLRQSQRAWIAYRDAECDGHVPMFWGGGTATAAIVLGCRTRLTRARTKELNDDYAER